jgi:hypothetical protein
MYSLEFKISKNDSVQFMRHREYMRELFYILKPSRWSIDKNFNIITQNIKSGVLNGVNKRT